MSDFKDPLLMAEVGCFLAAAIYGQHACEDMPLGEAIWIFTKPWNNTVTRFDQHGDGHEIRDPIVLGVDVFNDILEQYSREKTIGEVAIDLAKKVSGAEFAPGHKQLRAAA